MIYLNCYKGKLKNSPQNQNGNDQKLQNSYAVSYILFFVFVAHPTERVSMAQGLFEG